MQAPPQSSLENSSSKAASSAARAIQILPIAMTTFVYCIALANKQTNKYIDCNAMQLNTLRNRTEDALNRCVADQLSERAS